MSQLLRETNHSHNAEMSPKPPTTRRYFPFDIDDPVLARAAWSRIAEPDDRAAARVTQELGHCRALEWLSQAAVALDDTGGQSLPLHTPLPGSDRTARSSRAWSKAVARWMPRLAHLDIRREIDFLCRIGGQILTPQDPDWPCGLDDLQAPPHCLWLRGDRHALSDGGPRGQRAVAIVGSRAATRYGENVAERMSADLARHGVMIVSGGAYGIDAAAHRGAIRIGKTICVSAGGVDRLYPSGNSDLLRRVMESGVLIAEVPPGCQPGRHRFLSRNRIIAAMAAATVVVEAAWRSGALSTAHHAQELGRQVGAVPGPVTSIESAGCHRLLRNGAVCITDAEEALELLEPLGSVDSESNKSALSDERDRSLLDGLDPSCAAVLDAMPVRRSASSTAIAVSAGMSQADADAALALLELMGQAVRSQAGWRRAG